MSLILQRSSRFPEGMALPVVCFFEVRSLGQGFSTLELLTFDSRCFFVVGSNLAQCKMPLTSLVSQLANDSSPCPSLLVSVKRVSRHCRVCLNIWQKPWLTESYWHRSSTLYLNLPVCVSLQIWIDTDELTQRRYYIYRYTYQLLKHKVIRL